MNTKPYNPDLMNLAPGQKPLFGQLGKPSRLRGTKERFAPVDLNAHANGENSQLENALYDDIDPKHIIQRETPQHRQIINMVMAGYTYREVAAFMGTTAPTVSNTCRQPWARKYFIQEAKKTVTDEIKQLLEQQALPSINALVAVRDDPLTPAPAKVSAANSILDRFLGKPVQPISDNQKPPSEMSDEELKAAVERELQASTKPEV